MASVIASLALPAVFVTVAIVSIVMARNEPVEYFWLIALLVSFMPFMAIGWVFDSGVPCHAFLKSKFPRLFKHSELIRNVSLLLLHISVGAFALYLVFILVKTLGPLLIACAVECIEFLREIIALVDKLVA